MEDLACCKPTSASSEKSSERTAANAVDGNPDTRWTSAYSDEQWLAVDLEAVYALTSVRLRWEAAFAESYSLEASTDGIEWTTLSTETGCAGWVVTELEFHPEARWVRMHGHKRATGYGYSIWEFQVFGEAAATQSGSAAAKTGGVRPMLQPNRAGTTLQVQRLNGEPLMVSAEEDELVQQVRRRLAVELGVHATRVKLIGGGSILNDRTSVQELIEDETLLSLVVTPALLAVSGGGDCTVRVWDLDEKVCIACLEGHTRPVRAVDTDFLAERAASGSVDGTVRVWDLASMACIRCLSGPKKPVTCLSAHFQVERLISGSGDGKLRVWDLQAESCIQTLEGHWAAVMTVSADWEAKKALSGSDDATLQLWDLAGNERCGVLRGHIAPVYKVVADFSANLAVSASADTTLRIWDLWSQSCTVVLSGHTSAVTALSVDYKSQRAVSGAFDDTLRVWDLATKTLIGTVSSGGSKIFSVSVDSNDGASRAVGGLESGKLCVWDLEALACTSYLEGHAQGVVGSTVWAVSAGFGVLPAERRRIAKKQ